MNPENDKVVAFLEDYKALVEKHQIDFATYPVFVPVGTGEFKITVRNTPVSIAKPEESPVVADSE